MKELPKSVRDKLASRPIFAAHPDADLLGAFSEGSLSGSERELVMQHISVCSECREVVFLAAPPAEPVQQVIVPARGRMWRWLSPVAAIAVLAVGIGVFQQYRSKSPTGPTEQVLTATTTKPQSAPTSKNAITQSAPPSSPSIDPAKRNSAPSNSGTKTQSPRPQAERESEIAGLAAGTAGGAAATRAPDAADSRASASEVAAPRAEQTIEVTAAAPVIAVEDATPALPAPPPSSPVLAAKPAPAVVAKQRARESAESVEAPYAAESSVEVTAGYVPGRAASLVAFRPQWRITESGGLERSTASNQWQPVLQKSNADFRAVASVGSHVWAGGADGVLYHSTDGGQSWKKLAVGPGGHPITQAIRSILFKDERNGTVTFANGDTWVTNNAGRNWQKQ